MLDNRGTATAVTLNIDGIDVTVEKGHDRELVLRVWRMLLGAEYKRRQAPPGVKITARSFGRDRRYPIVNAFKGQR